MAGPYRISGAVFPKEIPNGPVFSGSIEIEGTKYNISLWEKQSKSGNSYLQISEDKRADQKQTAPSLASKFKRPAPPKKDDPDDPFGSDSIPF